MKTKVARMFRSPYAQSAAIHLLILLVLALFTINPVSRDIWHSFDWGAEPTVTENEPASSASEGLPEDLVDAVDHNTSNVAPVTDNPAPVAPSIPSPTPSLPIREELVQNPPATTTAVDQALASPAIPDRGRRIPGNTNGAGSGAGDGYELFGDGIEAIRTPLPSVRETDFGLLELSFKLNREGRIRMDTIQTITYSTRDHYEATLIALRSWQFRFLGRFNPDQTYRIKFRFVPRNG